MIISRSPMRVSLGGGGTDLPSYYTDHGGFVLSAAIDKYVYITLHETFVAELIVKYSRMEVVDRVEDVKHPHRPGGLEAGGRRYAPSGNHEYV